MKKKPKWIEKPCILTRRWFQCGGTGRASSTTKCWIRIRELTSIFVLTNCNVWRNLFNWNDLIDEDKSYQGGYPGSRLGDFGTSSIQSGPHSARFPSFPLTFQPNARCHIQRLRRSSKLAGQLFCVRKRRFLAKSIR